MESGSDFEILPPRDGKFCVSRRDTDAGRRQRQKHKRHEKEREGTRGGVPEAKLVRLLFCFRVAIFSLDLMEI